MGIETTLHGLQPNPLEVQVNRMKETAMEMAKYYFKGFGAALSGILGNASFYIEAPEKNAAKLAEAYNILTAVEEFYKEIKFQELQGREEYYPIFVVRSMLPKFRESLDRVRDLKSKDALTEFEHWAKALAFVGSIYGETFDSLLDKIRAQPGNAEYTVLVKFQSKKEIWHA